MEIQIQTKNCTLTKELSDYVKFQLGFENSTEYEQVHQVFVQLSELNDVKSGVNKNCFITVNIDGVPANIEVQNTEEDMEYAISLAAKRARKTTLLWLRRYCAKTA